MLLNINPDNPQLRKISTAVEVLDQGGVIIHPTDTFYGIGCDLHNKKAIDRVYQIKRRPKTQPFSFICPDLTEISRYAIVSNYSYKDHEAAAARALHLYSQGHQGRAKFMLTKRKEVGIRVPDNQIALSLARELGRPIISTSASLNDDDDLHANIELLYEEMGHLVDLVIDGGPQGLEPSSVISLIDDVPEVLRRGKGDCGFAFLTGPKPGNPDSFLTVTAMKGINRKTVRPSRGEDRSRS